MAETTTIEWTDATWNPWTGCTRVNEGCAHCYMERWARRAGREPWTVRRSSPRTFGLPLRLVPDDRVFVCSLSDFWHADADAWRADAYAVMRQRLDLTYIIPTKRPERIAGNLPADWGTRGWPNVWLGLSAATQERLDEGIEPLLAVAAPVHFLSLEPMVGEIREIYLDPVHVDEIGDGRLPYGDDGEFIDGINWVIVGGESGGRARPLHPAWVRGIRHKCIAARVPFFFKQWGEWLPAGQIRTAEQYAAFERRRTPHCQWGIHHSARIGRKLAGNVLDGHVWQESPKR